VLDSSDSIDDTDPNNWDKIVTFVTQIVDTYVIGLQDTRVAVVVFSDIGIITLNFTSYTNKQDLKSAILNIPFRNSFTNTADGLQKMREVFNTKYGARNDAPRLAIVITDGAHTTDTPDPIQVAERAQAEGITMLVVGIANAYEPEIIGMSSPPKEEGMTYWMTPDFDGLTSLLESLSSSSCKNSDSVCTLGKF
jgi:hypothetical protein